MVYVNGAIPMPRVTDGYQMDKSSFCYVGAMLTMAITMNECFYNTLWHSVHPHVICPRYTIMTVP